MNDVFNVRLMLLHAFAIALLVPGACGTTRPFRFDPATAAVLLAFLIATALVMPVLAARRKPALNKPCTVPRTGPS